MSSMTITRSHTTPAREAAGVSRRTTGREDAMSRGIPDPTRPHEVRVRVASDCDQIEIVDLVVVPRDDELAEIDLDRHVLGYIQQAGHVFVALVGERLDRAEECGQSLLWDKAAAQLVRSARLAAGSSAELRNRM